MRKKILVTRAQNQAVDFAEALEEKGFETVTFPVIEFAPPKDKTPLLEVSKKLETYDWLILTSANSVKYFIQALESTGKSISDINDIKVCAVGPHTAEAARLAGIKTSLIPKVYDAEGIIETLKSLGMEGRNVLFPRAEEGRDILPNGLRIIGAKVAIVPVYRTIKPEGLEEKLLSIIKEGIDVITFTSGSTVRNFLEILGDENRDLIKGVKIACLSHVTSNVAEKYGIKTDILPKESTTLSLAEAISDHLS